MYESCRGCFDICEDDINNTSPKDLDQDYGRNENGSSALSNSLPQNSVSEQKKYLSGSLLPDNVLYPKKIATDGDR